MSQIYTSSPQELKALDRAGLAAVAKHTAQRAKAGDIIALSGPLGAGKTTFVQYFMASLGADPLSITSPTYTLVHIYDVVKGGTVWHVDAYRLPDPSECLELGLDEAFVDGITLIEWPNKLGDFLPMRRIDVTITPTGAQFRDVILSARNRPPLWSWDILQKEVGKGRRANAELWEA